MITLDVCRSLRKYQTVIQLSSVVLHKNTSFFVCVDKKLIITLNPSLRRTPLFYLTIRNIRSFIIAGLWFYYGMRRPIK